MSYQHAAKKKPASPTCILVVEDDPAIGELLKVALTQEASYHPLLVSTAQEALRLVQAVRPVLFLLDYQLPQMTGIELYDHLHARNELRTVPAIVMSANVPQHELTKRHLVGVEKPFDLDDLFQTIEQVLSGSRGNGEKRDSTATLCGGRL